MHQRVKFSREIDVVVVTELLIDTIPKFSAFARYTKNTPSSTEQPIDGNSPIVISH